jgi:hypothetical protein
MLDTSDLSQIAYLCIHVPGICIHMEGTVYNVQETRYP